MSNKWNEINLFVRFMKRQIIVFKIFPHQHISCKAFLSFSLCCERIEAYEIFQDIRIFIGNDGETPKHRYNIIKKSWRVLASLMLQTLNMAVQIFGVPLVFIVTCECAKSGALCIPATEVSLYIPCGEHGGSQVLEKWRHYSYPLHSKDTIIKVELDKNIVEKKKSSIV